MYKIVFCCTNGAYSSRERGKKLASQKTTLHALTCSIASAAQETVGMG